jgi:hypothetical protein
MPWQFAVSHTDLYQILVHYYNRQLEQVHPNHRVLVDYFYHFKLLDKIVLIVDITKMMNFVLWH